MNMELHHETFEILRLVAEQYIGVNFETINDYGNSLCVSSENYLTEFDNFDSTVHVDITVHPGHHNFSQNYLSVHRTTYVDEHPHEYMTDCIDIPCTYITDDYYDKCSTRRDLMIPKDTFYRISSVLKELQKKQTHVNIVIIHYYLRIRVK